jgi:aryl-alcohol dehydrogenase-like predicted oxidoreductase
MLVACAVCGGSIRRFNPDHHASHHRLGHDRPRRRGFRSSGLSVTAAERAMDTRKLGGTGLEVSLVGLGCNNFGMRIDEAATKEVVAAALDAGIDFFDTADVYGGTRSEAYLGRALKGVPRDRVVIATKFTMAHGEGGPAGGASRRYVIDAVEASLRRLGTDHIDLYQQHRPDAGTPIDETLRALDDLVRSGKVRYVGHSNFTGWQIADADWTARTANTHRFVTAQNHYNLLDRRIEREVIPACERFGLGLLPYFPLASGLLTGKYRRGEEPGADTRLAHFGERGRRALSDDNFDVVEALEVFARERGRSMLELAMSWLAANPAVSSIIAGATRVDQIAANVAAVGWTMTPEDLAEIDRITRR